MRPLEGSNPPIRTQALESSQSMDEPMLLERMARLGLGSWDLSHAFELLADELWRLVEHDCASLLIYRRDRRALVVHATAPACGSRLTRGTQVPADGPISDLLGGVLSAAVCMDTASSCCALECYLYELSLRSCITIPLPSEGGLVGLLNLSSRRRAVFQSDQQAMLCQLQQPVSVALQHVMNNEQQPKGPTLFRAIVGPGQDALAA